MDLELSKISSSYTASDLIGTGLSLFNLALSDSVIGGYKKGTIVNIIGDSHTGKSLLALTCLAEISINPAFDDYRLVYDDAEAACSFNLGKMFGSALQRRVEPPAVDSDDSPIYSDTVQSLWDNLSYFLDLGTPFIYILDSLDALDSEEDQKKVIEQRDARKKGNKVSGSYGMSKPKTMSAMFKDIPKRLAKSQGLLIIISQVRDNIDPMSFQKHTRTGGRALTFYSTHVVWLFNAGAIKKKDKIVVGNNVKLKITKNKLTGKQREIEFSSYYDYGVDSIAASVKYLVENEWWELNKKTIDAKDLGITGTEAKLIEQIESKNLEGVLDESLECCWREGEDALKLNRKSKYA